MTLSSFQTYVISGFFFIFFPKYEPEKNIQNNVPVFLLGPQWARMYYFNVPLMYTLERNLSRMLVSQSGAAYSRLHLARPRFALTKFFE